MPDTKSTKKGKRSSALLQRSICSCTRCPRLTAFLAEHRQAHSDWWCKPVPGFGDPQARVLILGLAPGLKGANRTGRPFTGDAAGVWLYRVLHEKGLSSMAESVSRSDGLELRNVYIANAVKCVPPGNKPNGSEVTNCRDHLSREIKALRQAEVVVCLGKVSHDALLAVRRLSAPGMRLKDYAFGHGALHRFDSRPQIVVDSYHPSRQNTNTGRLTWEMWDDVMGKALEAAGMIAPET